MGALVWATEDGPEVGFFIAPHGGGTKLPGGVQVVTPRSSLGLAPPRHVPGAGPGAHERLLGSLEPRFSPHLLDWCLLIDGTAGARLGVAEGRSRAGISQHVTRGYIGPSQPRS